MATKTKKMKIRIESSSLVTPSSPTPHHIIPTSNIDLVIPRIHTPSVYFFRPPPSSSLNSAPTVDDFFSFPRLHLSLRHALVPFYPMAGRLRPRLAHHSSLLHGRLDIDCNARGVLLVEATAPDGCMDDFGDGRYFTPTVHMRDLIPLVDGYDDCPLLILQITRFRCGGVALGVGVQHHLADGIASLAFISYWAKLNSAAATAAATTFPPPQPLPFFDRSLLMARHPPSPIFVHVEYQPPPPLLHPASSPCRHSTRRHQKQYSAVFADYKPSMANHDAEAYWKKEEEEEDFESGHPNPSSTLANVDEIASDLFVFTAEQLERLKWIASTGGGCEDRAPAPAELTSYEILSAHVWKCVCAARGLVEEQESKLYIATDGRRRLRPALPEGYFGNAIFTATPMRKAGEIVRGRLAETAMAIRAALERMGDEYLRSAIDYLEEQPSLAALARGAHTFRSPNLGITSWARLPIYDADFGWGKPIWMGPAGVPFEGLAYLLPPPPAETPTSAADARMLLSITLAPSHMHIFRTLLYYF